MRHGKRVAQPGHFLPFILVKSGVCREGLGGGGVGLERSFVLEKLRLDFCLKECCVDCL